MYWPEVHFFNTRVGRNSSGYSVPCPAHFLIYVPFSLVYLLVLSFTSSLLTFRTGAGQLPNKGVGWIVGWATNVSCSEHVGEGKKPW